MATGDAQLVQLLLDNGASTEVRTAARRTQLFTAVHYHRRELVELLVERGAAVNFQDVGGLTPLHLAAASGDVAIYQRLLQAGANEGAHVDNVHLMCPALYGLTREPTRLNAETVVFLFDQWMTLDVLYDQDWMKIIYESVDPATVEILVQRITRTRNLKPSVNIRLFFNHSPHQLSSRLIVMK